MDGNGGKKKSRRISQNEASCRKTADTLHHTGSDVMHLGEKHSEQYLPNHLNHACTFSSSSCGRKAESLASLKQSVHSVVANQKKGIKHCVSLGRVLKTRYLNMLPYKATKHPQFVVSSCPCARRNTTWS